MKHTWQPNEVEYLEKTYPHCGTVLFLKKFPYIPLNKVRSKCDKMALVELPKEERFCIECNKEKQLPRYFLCKKCFNIERKNRRRTYNISTQSRLSEMLRSCRYRSTEPCDLTVDFLEELLKKQDGKCYYSDMPMVFENYGKGRNPQSVSIDRKDSSRGYTRDNVVLCCWAVNAGKNEMAAKEYLNICRAVVEHSKKWLDNQAN